MVHATATRPSPLPGSVSSAPLSARVEPVSADWLARYAGFAAGAVHGVAQHPVWVNGWVRHAVADALGMTLEAQGAPVLMLALAVERRGPLRIAGFPGGSHANANFPATRAGWTGDPASTRAALRRAFRAARPDIDLLHSERMLPRLGGTENPFLGDTLARSPNPALALALAPTMAETLERMNDRRRARTRRTKGRKLEAFGPMRRIEARSAGEVDYVLAEFFRFKQIRLREAGIRNVFGDPAVQSAFRDTFTAALSAESKPFVLHALEVAGAVRAVTGSSQTPERITCEFVGISQDDLTRHSPGEVLFFDNIAAACADGKAYFDFGIGDEPYKRNWCDIETLHADEALPLTLRGRVGALLLDGARRGKLAIKGNPALWQAFLRLRRAGAGRRDRPADED